MIAVVASRSIFGARRRLCSARPSWAPGDEHAAEAPKNLRGARSQGSGASQVLDRFDLALRGSERVGQVDAAEGVVPHQDRLLEHADGALGAVELEVLHAEVVQRSEVLGGRFDGLLERGEGLERLAEPLVEAGPREPGVDVARIGQQRAIQVRVGLVGVAAAAGDPARRHGVGGSAGAPSPAVSNA